MTGWFTALREAFHNPRARSYRWVERGVWLLILASMVLIALDVDERTSPALRQSVQSLDLVVLWAFVVEYVLRVATYDPPTLRVLSGTLAYRTRQHIEGRLRYALSPAMMIDLLAILAVVPAMRGLRALRLLRLVRGIRFFQYSRPALGIVRSFQENALLYAFNITFLLVIVNVGGVSLFLAERGVNPGVTRVQDGVWWALVTVTTVGYGDINPVTMMGRVIAGAVMVAGMFTLALFAGTVGSTLLRALMNLREDSFRMSSFTDHVVVCGYDPAANILLEALRDELCVAPAEIVVFAPGERPPTLPNEFVWVSGDPTKESELDKVRLPLARAAIVVGVRAHSIEEADARSILVTFTLRAYLQKDDISSRRREPLHVIVEILDPENRDHARTAGADEVVETTRVGFDMLAHAAVVPGAGDIMTRMVAAGANSLFIEPNPIDHGETFGEVARDVRERYGVILLGVRSASTGQVALNPRDDLPVAVEDELVYLAPRPAFGEPKHPA